MRDTYTFLYQRTGTDLEDAMMEVLKEYSHVIHATKEQDEHEGTDALVDGLRMDFTLNYKGKNYTEHIGSWRGWDVGIRTANGAVRFNEPVLVFGITVDAKYAKSYVIPRLKAELGDIEIMLGRLSDLYWSWIDRHPQYDM